MGVVAGVNDFKKQHPRGFVGAICGSVFFLLVLLSSRRNGIRESFTPYAYSPYGGETPLTLAIRPAGIKAAATRAEQLWANNVKKRNEFIKWKGGVDAIRMFTPREEPGWGQLYTIWDIFVPAFPCIWEQERIGRVVDGGKYTCGLPRIAEVRRDKCVVYSFGVAQESSWEAELLERTECEIYMYDFSVEKYGPQIEWLDEPLRKRAHFFPYGIASKDGHVDGTPFYTLKTLMKMNGHDWIDILKVDVEGAEFQVLPDIIEEFGDNSLPFEQLLLELHVNEVRPTAYDAKAFIGFWNTLEAAGLRAFASELNYPALHFTEYPQAIEINFLNYGGRRMSKSKLLID
ncbi:MAG: hypothetical protein CYPHOPRED_004889 [Cyphobasidiales sp. Tagirdzhanova-0007]|nr:MAG: hypothetical protein CYPHOPRED_004889 [Cyphobasidiales sp. Tagirdzhanova-0007]